MLGPKIGFLDAEQYLRLAHRWDPNSTQRLVSIYEEVQTKTAEAPRLNAMFSHAMPQLTLQNSLYSAQGPCSTSAFWEQ